MILFIDTSCAETKIALIKGANFLAKKTWLSAKNQSEELLSEVELLLKSIGKNKFDLKKILVVAGPGSYTGLRVGLSTANALALGLNISVESADLNFFEEKLNKNSKKAESHFTGGVMPKYLHQPKITKEKTRR